MKSLLTLIKAMRYFTEGELGKYSDMVFCYSVVRVAWQKQGVQEADHRYPLVGSHSAIFGKTFEGFLGKSFGNS